MVALRAVAFLRKRVARPFLHRLRRPYVLPRMARPSEVRLMGHRLRTRPDVFHPIFFSSSRILAEHILERPLRGLRVLDMGTGAGPIAVAAAAAGARVTACDLNPQAVALTRENCALNGLASEVLQSDLFAALSGRCFDLICFNLPFYDRDPDNLFEAAFKGGKNLDTVRRFALGCTRHLDDAGVVVVIFSEDSDRNRILRAFADTGFSVEAERVTRRLLEDFHLVSFKRRIASSG